MISIPSRTDWPFRSPPGALRTGRKTGKCELCGGHGRVLHVIVIADFIGWACEECHRQLRESMTRLYCGTWEHTEPGE